PNMTQRRESYIEYMKLRDESHNFNTNDIETHIETLITYINKYSFDNYCYSLIQRFLIDLRYQIVKLGYILPYDTSVKRNIYTLFTQLLEYQYLPDSFNQQCLIHAYKVIAKTLTNEEEIIQLIDSEESTMEIFNKEYISDLFLKSLKHLTIKLKEKRTMDTMVNQHLFHNESLLEELCIQEGLLEPLNIQLSYHLCNITIELDFYDHLLILFDYIPRVQVLDVKCRSFIYNSANKFIDYNYENLSSKIIPRLLNFKLFVAKLRTENDYLIIERLIQNLKTLKYLSFFIGHIPVLIKDIGNRFQQCLIPENVIEFSFYLKCSHNRSKQQTPTMIMSSNFINNNEFWLNKLNCHILCYTDYNNRYCYLYTWPFDLNSKYVDCVSHGIDDLQTNCDQLKLEQVSFINSSAHV
ncbi:unnamed protein product, partial [Didymodactylos carnosus]